MRLAVVIHHDGRRDVHLLTEEDDEPAAILAFTDLQARTLASVLEGAYARPTAGDTGHE